jgi:hypothetical protein
VIAENDRHWMTVIDAARRAIAQGERPWYGATYCRERDGSYQVVVEELPNVSLIVTGRKGVEAAVRARIALVLDVPEDAFELSIKGYPKTGRANERGSS